jgi:hypothetical protein
MPRCIYCQQHKSGDGFTKVEHVMPQSFGQFQNNFTLRNLAVCLRNREAFGFRARRRCIFSSTSALSKSPRTLLLEV